MTSPSSDDAATWAHTPERSNALLLRIMALLSLRLGRSVGRIVLHLIAAYFLLFAPASRRASGNYLRRALGHRPRWRDLYQHFFTFAATIHDRIYLAKRRFDLFEFEVHGEDTLRRLLADRKGLLLIGAHLGSFDVMHALGRKDTDLRIAMVMHQDNAQKINAMLAAISPEAVQDIIALGNIDSMLKVRDHLDDGGIVGMLADRTPGNERVHPVQMLGAEALLPRGPWRMAAMLQRPVLFMTGLYLGGNRYAIHFEPLADFSDLGPSQRDAALDTAITRYAALLDHYCRRAPYNWFNFYDFWAPAKSQ